MVNLAESMNKSSTSSFGGTWGSEKKLALTFTAGEIPTDPDVVAGFTSVSRADYTMDPFVKSKNQNQSKFHKFVSYFSLFDG